MTPGDWWEGFELGCQLGRAAAFDEVRRRREERDAYALAQIDALEALADAEARERGPHWAALLADAYREEVGA